MNVQLDVIIYTADGNQESHYYLIIGCTSVIKHSLMCPSYSLTDTTLTHSNLSTVLNHVMDMDNLMPCLNIPYSVRRKIREHSESEEQQRDECMQYWRTISPYSMIGWGSLAGWLHYYGEEAALRAANGYIERAPGTCGSRVERSAVVP